MVIVTMPASAAGGVGLTSSGAVVPFVGGRVGVGIFVPSCSPNAWRVAFAASSDGTYAPLLDGAGDPVNVSSGPGRTWCVLPYVPTTFLRLEVASACTAVMSCIVTAFR